MCRLIRVPFVSAAKFMFSFYVPVTHILHKRYILKTSSSADCYLYAVPSGVCHVSAYGIGTCITATFKPRMK